MSGRPNNAPAGEQHDRNEESLVAPVACGGGASDRRGTLIAAAQWNGSLPPDPALIGLVRLLAQQAAREGFEAARRPEDGGGEFE